MRVLPSHAVRLISSVAPSLLPYDIPFGAKLVVLLRDPLIMAVLIWRHIVPAHKGAAKANRFAVV